MHLALFDLDHTLLDGDSNSLWLSYLVAAGQLPATVLHRQAEEYARYEAGILDIAAYLDFHLSLLAGWPLAEWLPWRERFVAEVIAPRISRDAMASVAGHRERGDLLAIVTATHSFLAEGIAELFMPIALIAPQAGVEDGCLNGRIVGEISYGERKPDAVRVWLARHGLKLADFASVHCYSDSSNDLPLLEMASHPNVVNGDPALARLASCRGWPALEWRTRAPGTGRLADAAGDGSVPGEDGAAHPRAVDRRSAGLRGRHSDGAEV